LYALHVKGTAFLWHQVGLASPTMLLRAVALAAAQLHTILCCRLQYY